MATMLDVMTNRPGGVFHFTQRFHWYEGEDLALSIQITEYDGGPPVDCTGWSVEESGIYGNPRKPVGGDLGLTLTSTLSSTGLLTIAGESAISQNAAGVAAQYPDGRAAWIYVRVGDGTHSTYLIKPSPILLKQGPGTGS